MLLSTVGMKKRHRPDGVDGGVCLFLAVTRRQFLAQCLLNVCYDIVDILDTYR